MPEITQFLALPSWLILAWLLLHGRKRIKFGVELE